MATLLDAASLGLGDLPALDSDELGPLAEEFLREDFAQDWRGPLQHMEEAPTTLGFGAVAERNQGHYNLDPYQPAGPAASSHLQRTTTTGGATTSEAQEFEEFEEQDAAEGGAGGGGGKRRRRIRNSKQQELNRLAQQRYRMRKKEKFGELQVAVNSLSDKVQQLRILEAEAQQLRAAKVTLGQQLHQRDATLQQLNTALGAQAAALSATSKRAEQLEKQLDTATAQLESVKQHNQQLEAQARAAQAAAAAASSSSASLPAGIDPQALADRLMSIVKVALSDVAMQQPAATSLLTSEAIAASISRTLTSCCRELLTAQLPSKHLAGADTNMAVAVSCM